MTLPPPDPDQIEAARAGSPDAWHALFSRWCPVVLGWCRYLGAGRIDPEDAAHDVFVRLHRRFHALTSAARFRPFLYGITRRVVAEHRRRLWWQRWSPWPLTPGASDPRPDPERRCSLGEAAAEIDDILQRIPARHREVLVLCAVEGLTHAEASELLGVPPGTVKSRLSRGMSSFRAEADRRGLTLGAVLAEGAHG
jgi:RNA polymerase sigma factor (sigma-70 family)